MERVYTDRYPEKIEYTQADTLHSELNGSMSCNILPRLFPSSGETSCQDQD